MLRPGVVASWLGALVALGGGLSFLPAARLGTEPASEVARWAALLGAAGLLHLAAILSGRRAPSDARGRRSFLAPALLYGSTFLVWLGMELSVGVAWASEVPTWSFVGTCAVAALVGLVTLRRGDAGERITGVVLVGLWLVSVVGGLHVLRPELVGAAGALWAVAALAAGIAWANLDGHVSLPFADAPGLRRTRSNTGEGNALGPFLRDVARGTDPIEIVEPLRGVLESHGAVLAAVVAGEADAALVEVAPCEDGGVLTIEPADPLYVAFRAGTTVTADSVESPSNAAPARAAVHRLSALNVVAAVPLSAGERYVGAVLIRSDGALKPSVLSWLAEAGPSVGLALESAAARAALRTAEAPNTSAPIPVRESDGSSSAHGIVGTSSVIRSVVEQIERVAPTDAAVFIQGETGTGKERAVEAIHGLSGRADRELVKIPCAALPEELLESELFGYEPGAFTGAVDRKEGRFEVADGGTIFFDDVDTLPSGVQAKLLRALQEGEVQRLGSNRVLRVNARIVSATNRDLLAAVAAGTFREDLYYRLNVVPIVLPPLRDRKEDIPVLIDHFLATDGRRLGRTVEGIDPESLRQLHGYEWPGNVRELRNVIERALVMNDGEILRVPRPASAEAPARADEPDGLGRASLPELLRRYKIQLVTRALEQSGGNQRKAAELLGIHRPSLTRMVRELGLRGGTPEKRQPKTGSD